MADLLARLVPATLPLSAEHVGFLKETCRNPKCGVTMPHSVVNECKVCPERHLDIQCRRCGQRFYSNATGTILQTPQG